MLIPTINILGISVFVICFLKFFFHYKYLQKLELSNDAKLSEPSQFEVAIKKYVLLFRASIMFPILSKKGDRRDVLVINALVSLFYLTIVGVYLLLHLTS